MYNQTFDTQTFRLRCGAVDCDKSGLRVGGHELLILSGHSEARVSYSLPSTEELEERLFRAYGCEISAAGKLGGLSVVAQALNNGEVARAQIAALHLQLPNPPVSVSSTLALAKRLQDCGWLLKDSDPVKHPRTGEPPNPGWFPPTDGGDDSGNDAPALNEFGQNTEATRATIPDDGSGQRIAVLTDNFNYACRTLRLDRNAASEILHQLKRRAGLDGDDNCTFDTETGDVYFNGEHIGNHTV